MDIIDPLSINNEIMILFFLNMTQHAMCRVRFSQPRITRAVNSQWARSPEELNRLGVGK